MVYMIQVANKLYPISSTAQQIEDFALEKLLSIVTAESEVCLDTKGSTIEPHKVLLLLYSR